MDTPGKFNRRITLRRPVVTRGAGGGEIKAYADLTQTWCRAEFTETGSDTTESSRQVLALRRAVFTIRSRRDLTVSITDRAVFAGLTYHIRSVVPDGDRLEYVRLECEQTGEQKTT